jgi:hypothetical protein
MAANHLDYLIDGSFDNTVADKLLLSPIRHVNGQLMGRASFRSRRGADATT